MWSTSLYHLMGPSDETGGTVAQNLSTAAAWTGFSFIAEGLTLTEARVYVSAVTGTLPATNLTCSLEAGAAGVPDGSSIETVADNGGGNVAVGWRGFTFNTALTAGKQYWLVFKNTHGTPASNYATIRTTLTVPYVFVHGPARYGGWLRKTTTDSGTNWGSPGSGTFRIRYGTDQYRGIPAQDMAISASTESVYSAREIGTVFTAPSDVRLRVRGIVLLLGADANTPTGNVRGRLYSATGFPGTAPTLLATSAYFQPRESPGAFFQHFIFDSVQVLTAGQRYLATLGETTQSDTSTNRYTVRIVSWDTDANSLALIPHALRLGYYDGSSWTESERSVPSALILESGSEFLA